MTVDEFCETIETKIKGGLNAVVVLYVIASVKNRIHGYLITKALDELTKSRLQIQAGTLYPILKNLENHGLIEHKIIKSVEGPPKKTYRLTKDGKNALKRIVPIMDDIFDSIGKVRDADWEKV